MTKETHPIPFDEFARNLETLFERVIRENETVVVETADGERAVLKPAATTRRLREKTEADLAAFLSSAGGWQDVDVDAFLKDNYESRRTRSRPPVEL